MFDFFSLTDTIGVGFSLYQGVVGGRVKTKMIGPSPRAPAGGHAPEIELCLKESETSGSQSIVFLILIGLRSITFLKAQPDSDLPDGVSGTRRGRGCTPGSSSYQGQGRGGGAVNSTHRHRVWWLPSGYVFDTW